MIEMSPDPVPWIASLLRAGGELVAGRRAGSRLGDAAGCGCTSGIGGDAVIRLSEPQVWVLIGILCLLVVGILAWQTASVSKTVSDAMKRVEIRVDGLTRLVEGRLGSLDAEVAQLRDELGSLREEVATIAERLQDREEDLRETEVLGEGAAPGGTAG